MRTFTQKPKASKPSDSAKSSMPGRALSRQNRDTYPILYLQRTIGNQAVQRLLQSKIEDLEASSANNTVTGFAHDFSRIPVHAATPVAVQLQPSFGKGDKEPNLAPELQEEPALAPPQIEPTKPVLTPEVSVSGTVQDIKTPPEEGRRTGEEELAADLQTPGGVGNVVADIQINFSHPKTDRLGGGKDDPVVSGMSIGSFSQPGGRAVSPFGAEFYEPAFTGISYAFAGGKCTITAKLDVVCPWGTNGGGRTDVPSATDAVVTKAKWPAIKADLEPAAASPFKSPRTTYYSQSLVERHEKFHGTDDNAWTSASGLGIVKAHLEAGTVTSGSAATDVPALVNGARTKLIRENFKWYKGGGASHGSYAGEIRAYADGKAVYQKLADDVEKHGKSLL